MTLTNHREQIRNLILKNFTAQATGYRLHPGQAADDVLEYLEPVVRELLAQAWDNGRRTGSSKAMRHMSDEPGLSLATERDNPYRED